MKTSLPLWTAEIPGSSIVDDFVPKLDCYPLETKQPGGAVIVCPGGGYQGLSESEAAPVAERFNELGFHSFVCRYRVSPHRHPEPLMDLSRAIRMVRSKASKWNLDPKKIAVCGLSAGGHLAATATVSPHLCPPDEDAHPLESYSNQPNASILCYPVITETQSAAHLPSFENLLGERSDKPTLRKALSPERHVEPNTPPCFIWHTIEDQVVPVENALLFALALRTHEVPFALHVFPHGPHGLNLGYGLPQVSRWSELACDWLKAMGW